MFHKTTFILLLLWDSSQGYQVPRVTTPLGEIRGYHKKSYGGRIFSAFEGIPFAKPPVGNLRFKEPQKAESWSGIWDATTVHECIQLEWPQTTIIGNEDCLYLNIYVPKPQPEPGEALNVLVIIHGGAFMLGSPKLTGPDYLMDRDIIHISINYRVGALGFLSTEDSVVPGNNGMKDQVFALKWIQDNIAHFGGNPKTVTIVGESAGAACVHFHYFSRLSKGLFHQGISHSGTALAPWAIQEAPLIKARQLAASVGCNQQLTQEFIDCMKQRSAKHLTQNVDIFYANYKLPFSPFALVIEQNGETSFLTDYPYNLLDSGHVYNVPWLASVTTEEGLFPAIFFINILDKVEEEWNNIMPHSLDYNYTARDSDKLIVSQRIKEFYFGDDKLSRDNFKTLIKPPENELQKGERVMSEHQLRIQRSLQKLTIPEWYKHCQVPREGFLLKKNTTRERWTGTSSKTPSLSSLGSSGQSPIVLSPTPHSQPFVRWSTSKLNSTASSPCASTRSSFNTRQPNGSISPSSVRSSFSYRQPYLGWRSQERLTRPRTPAERLASSLIVQNQIQSQHQHCAQQESPEIHTSIKEVTSAIVHYVSGLKPEFAANVDSTHPRSSSVSPRGSQKLCWLESSFVGTRPLDTPETPVTLAESHTPTPPPVSNLRLELQKTHNGESVHA